MNRKKITSESVTEGIPIRYAIELPTRYWMRCWRRMVMPAVLVR